MRALSRLVLGGIKFANGENPKGAYGGKNQAPGTRMKIAALQREILAKAQGYKAAMGHLPPGGRRQEEDAPRARPGPGAAGRSARTPPHGALSLHRADDILTAVRLAKEFGFEIVLQHCTEGYRVAAELAKEGIWVSLTLVDSPGGKPEVMGLLGRERGHPARGGRQSRH